MGGVREERRQRSALRGQVEAVVGASLLAMRSEHDDGGPCYAGWLHVVPDVVHGMRSLLSSRKMSFLSRIAGFCGAD